MYTRNTPGNIASNDAATEPNYNLPPYHLSKIVPGCVCQGCGRLASQPQPSTKGRPGPATIDKDSLYYSRERYRLIPQRTGAFTIQYLVIDSYENEIVGAHAKMSDAVAQRDALDPVSP